MPLTQGQELNNRYRIVTLIGQGGFGAVYRAWDLTLKRPCAVKENLDASAEAQKQFDREVQLLANLHHSNLPRIYDYFFLPGMGQYLAMDFIEGQDLQTMLDTRGSLPEAEVVPWVRQICDALEYVHSQTPPVIHRDIKPANIIITPQGRAVLVDFGISKVYDPHLKTTVGARAVTPGFSPWEQYGQGTTDNRSDLYALGATLYTLLTGQEPPESVALLGGMATLTPPRQLNPALAPHVAQTIEKALQSHPMDRHPNAAALAQALLPPKSGTPWLWGVGGMVVLLLMGLGFVFGRGNGADLVVMEVTPMVSVAPIDTKSSTPNVIKEPDLTPTMEILPVTPIPSSFSEETPTSESVLTPQHKVAYSSDQEGNFEIFIMNIDGTMQIRLTNNTSNDARVSWSPDGKRLLFTSDVDGNLEIYTMNVDGTEVTRLTNNTVDEYGPAWSPSGLQIAYYSNQDGDNDIYLLTLDNLQQTRLTNNNHDDREPDWSPDGKQIIYESTPPNSTKQIYVINSDGSGETRLTGADSGDNLDPAFSPDGQHLAFFSNRDGNYEIYIMRVDELDSTRLTNDDGNDFSPDFSGDGKFIFFHSNRTGNYEIYRMNLDGSGLINLTNSKANDRWAAAQP